MAKRAGRSRPTILDVARAAGVSAATVSNALNDRRYVEAGTKRRIAASASRLGYTPNVHARRLRTTGVGAIGLFSSMPFAISSHASRLGFLMEIAATAALHALENGYGLLLLPSTASGLPNFDELAIDGAIVVEPSADDPYVAQVRRRGVPLVTIGSQPGAPRNAFAVDLRSAETATVLLHHLRAQGARRIVLITGSARRTSYVETEAVYAAFAATHAMDALVVRVDEARGEGGAYDATAEIMRTHPRTDAILALVDTFATGALRALSDANVAVPGRVRVATRFDGNRARESTPQLTAVDLRLNEIAATAVTLLLEHLRGRRGGRIVPAAIPELIPRASTVGDRPARRSH